MRKSILIAAGLTTALSGIAHAETQVLASGTILVGNPLGAVAGGVSELAATCASGIPEANGIDGLAFTVPDEALGKNATLATSGEYAIDADVYWYTSDCSYIDDETMATESADEAGIVPIDASYGVVDLILGAQAEVVLTATL